MDSETERLMETERQMDSKGGMDSKVQMDAASQRLIQEMLAEERSVFPDALVSRWSLADSETLVSALRAYGRDYELIAGLFKGRKTHQQIKKRTALLLQQKLLSEHELLLREDFLAKDENRVVDHASTEAVKVEEGKDEPTRQDSPVLSITDDETFNNNASESAELVLPFASDQDEEDSTFKTAYENKPAYLLPLDTPPNIPTSVDPKKLVVRHVDPDVVPTLDKDFVITDLEVILPIERIRNAEFFTGETTSKNKNKTPDRYKRIRNYIIQLWETKKPVFVTKSAARRGLIGNGDVSAISRVWEFLVECGAINKGALRRKALEKKTSDLDDSTEEAPTRIISSSKRSRRIKDESGNWVDEKDMESTVIDHEKLATETLAEQAKLAKLLAENMDSPLGKRQKHDHDHFYEEHSDSWKTNPFKLVKPDPPLVNPPFHVSVSSRAMLLLEFHSHLAHTEVIGLLGGSWCAQEGRLKVQLAYPCKSTSTEVQCEMDPVSEMNAREEFAKRGLVVVGWYHSHPTFVTYPSIRDIENQAAYQELFRQECPDLQGNSWVEPFIGIIVNPYPPESDVGSIKGDRMRSRVSYIGISHEWDPENGHRIPYSIDVQMNNEGHDYVDTEESFRELVEWYAEYEHRVCLSEALLPDKTTRFDKLMTSLRYHGYEADLKTVEDILGKLLN